jgi:flagellar biosynthesis protein FliR
VGFPITLVTGFVALYLSIPIIGPGLVRMFEQAVMFLLSMVQALR